MRPAAAAIALLALLAQNANAASALDITLVLPHPLRAGEAAWIEVQVGPIGHQEIDVTTASGQELGVISPFGVRVGRMPEPIRCPCRETRSVTSAFP